MNKTLNFFLVGLLVSLMAVGCKKQDDSTTRLAKFAQEINAAPDKDLSNGTVLTGCEYAEGDSLFTYVLSISDNRYDKLEEDSIKRNFENSVKSDKMSKIINLLNKANVGLRYKLVLPEKEMSIKFSNAEIADIHNSRSK